MKLACESSSITILLLGVYVNVGTASFRTFKSNKLLKIRTCGSCWLFRTGNDSFEVEWRLNLRINYKVCNYFWLEYAKNGKKTWNQRELNRIRDTLNQNWKCWRCFRFVILPRNSFSIVRIGNSLPQTFWMFSFRLPEQFIWGWGF